MFGHGKNTAHARLISQLTEIAQHSSPISQIQQWGMARAMLQLANECPPGQIPKRFLALLAPYKIVSDNGISPVLRALRMYVIACS